jgi:hypothetical protein
VSVQLVQQLEPLVAQLFALQLAVGPQRSQWVATEQHNQTMK